MALLGLLLAAWVSLRSSSQNSGETRPRMTISRTLSWICGLLSLRKSNGWRGITEIRLATGAALLGRLWRRRPRS
uniref:Uncharacterized protein n=1 Tax=uncultured marine virus TaxID=186617 RepID=A0A0F7L6U9_9VIRU|nr:hypothetical protein [uncultured marine virus]